MMGIYWAFMHRWINVEGLVGEKVAYSWTCNIKGHVHTIRCLWIWHDCDMNLDMERVKNAKRIDDAVGWKPGGVGLHTLISSNPLHIEASVVWPDCCGMHGFIRDGKWVPV